MVTDFVNLMAVQAEFEAAGAVAKLGRAREI